VFLEQYKTWWLRESIHLLSLLNLRRPKANALTFFCSILSFAWISFREHCRIGDDVLRQFVTALEAQSRPWRLEGLQA
jgi:hypothetical protein